MKILSEKLPLEDFIYLNFLYYHWLSPGTAILLYCMSRDLRRLPLTSPSIDVSCGNGTFTFMALGGLLNPESTIPVQNLPFQFDVGTELHEPFLSQAASLRFYKQLVAHDNNLPTFPFENESFATVYCNALYWLNDPGLFLRELYRVMKPGAKALFHVMTPELLRPYDILKRYVDAEMVDQMDRFKRYPIPHVNYQYPQWKHAMEAAGFQITEVVSTVPNLTINMLMNMDLSILDREIKKAMSYVPPKELANLRNSWVQKIACFCRPLLEAEPKYTVENTPYLGFFVEKSL